MYMSFDQVGRREPQDMFPATADAAETVVPRSSRRIKARWLLAGWAALSILWAGGVSYSLVNEDSDAPRLAAIPEAVHAEGGRVLLQLFHAGRYAFEKSFGLQPVAPSAVGPTRIRAKPTSGCSDRQVSIMRLSAAPTSSVRIRSATCSPHPTRRRATWVAWRAAWAVPPRA